MSALLDFTHYEADRLAKCEATIERGLATFVDVGTALLEVRDSRLYRAQYATFEAYCAERWNLSRPRAYQLIDAANVVQGLSTTVDIVPTNEAQARELAGLTPEAQREAWQLAVETAPEGKVTAAHVRAVVRINEALADAPEPVQDVVRHYGVADADTITELTRLHKQRRDTFAEVAASGYIQPGDEDDAVHISDGVLKVKDALRKKERTHRALAMDEQRAFDHARVETVADALALTAGTRYQTVVIDPPWDWGDEGDVNQFGRAKPTYATMPIDEIAALPIGQIADDNAHLYLWITNRSLPKGFSLIEQWGFRYVTTLTWVKPSFGMGNYYRGSTEHVLFAVRGSLPLLRHDVGTHFEAPRGSGHSAKPAEFYRLIETCSPGPRIDMFARIERPGWTVWGNVA